jgi:hypothetical protein
MPEEVGFFIESFSPMGAHYLSLPEAQSEFRDIG